MSVVRCPFCDRRYNVTGIPSGTKVLCTSCRATLTVPVLHRLSSGFWQRKSTLLLAGLVGGFVVATVAYMGIHGRVGATIPLVSTPVAHRSAGIKGPAMMRPIPTREEQILAVEQSLAEEFPEIKFEYDCRKTFLIAGEARADFELAPDGLHKALENLQTTFQTEFGGPLDLDDPQELLPIVLFTRRETFDTYMRRNNNSALPPEVPGLYEYSNQRVVFYHPTEGYPYEVLLHEATHQLVHYYWRTRGARQQPSWWFQEGIATYFEQWKLGATGHVVVDSGTPSKRLAVLKEALRCDGQLPQLFNLLGMDVETLWNHWNESKKDPESKKKTVRDTQLRYAEAWALVHFLRHGENGKYRSMFTEYMRRELDGRGSKAEFERLLADRFSSMELSKLQIELEKYIRELP